MRERQAVVSVSLVAWFLAASVDCTSHPALPDAAVPPDVGGPDTGPLVDAPGSNMGSGLALVSDGWHHRIVTLDLSTGALTGFGSAGTGSDQFDTPYGVAKDAIGRIYVADGSTDRFSASGANRIVRFDDTTGANWTTYGTFGIGSGQFRAPGGISIDSSGRIYIADYLNSRVVRIDDMLGGNWTTFGTYGIGSNHFRGVTSVSVGGPGEKIYVADEGNTRVVQMDDMTGTNFTTFGSFGSGSNQFSNPEGIFVDASGKIYVTDKGNASRIARMDDIRGSNWVTLGSLGAGSGHFVQPTGVYVDGANHIYVVDSGNNRVVRFDDMTGANWVSFGVGSGSGAASLDHPYNVIAP